MDPNSPPRRTGEAPSRRPPEDIPERIGEGELGSDDDPPVGQIQINDREDFMTFRRPPSRTELEGCQGDDDGEAGS